MTIGQRRNNKLSHAMVAEDLEAFERLSVGIGADSSPTARFYLLLAPGGRRRLQCVELRVRDRRFLMDAPIDHTMMRARNDGCRVRRYSATQSTGVGKVHSRLPNPPINSISLPWHSLPQSQSIRSMRRL